MAEAVMIGARYDVLSRESIVVVIGRSAPGFTGIYTGTADEAVITVFLTTPYPRAGIIGAAEPVDKASGGEEYRQDNTDDSADHGTVRSGPAGLLGRIDTEDNGGDTEYGCNSGGNQSPAEGADGTAHNP